MPTSLIWFLLVPLWGPQQSPATQPPKPQNQPAAKGTAKPKDQTSGTSNDRLFFTLPNFFTLENAADAPPLTAGQKFKTTARSSFDPVELAWYGLLAGISQWENDDAVYGQGMEGFAKRYGVRFADGTIENFFTKAIFPSVLHEDPRYFQMGEGGFPHRALYAVSRIFITRTDSGASTFNFSEVVGSAAAATVSAYSYHSSDARNITSASHVWFTQMCFDALSNGLKEFWPDIHRKLSKSKSGQNH